MIQQLLMWPIQHEQTFMALLLVYLAGYLTRWARGGHWRELFSTDVEEDSAPTPDSKNQVTKQ